MSKDRWGTLGRVACIVKENFSWSVAVKQLHSNRPQKIEHRYRPFRLFPVPAPQNFGDCEPFGQPGTFYGVFMADAITSASK